MDDIIKKISEVLDRTEVAPEDLVEGRVEFTDLVDYYNLQRYALEEVRSSLMNKGQVTKEAIKKTAVEPVNPLEGDDALSGIDDAGDTDLGGGDLGGGDLGGLGGGLDGGLGGGLDEVAEGLDNDYYDALKITRTPDLDNQIQHDDMDELDYTKLT